MPKKKKPKRFTAVEAVKEMARDRIGMPPGEKVVPNKKKPRKEKHKRTMAEILSEQN